MKKIASPDSRLAHERWRTWLPLAALLIALIALVLLPVLRAAQLRPIYDDMQTVTEPSRSLLTRIHVALALEQSLLRDYLEDGDSVTVARYRKAVEDEKRAYSELAPLVSRLGPEARSELGQLREVETAWHSAVESFLARSRTARLPRDPLHAKLYENLLLSAARLDAAINNAAARRWVQISATNSAQQGITIAIGIVALAAASIVAWLGRRLSSYAVSEEAARQELEEAVEGRARLMRGITHDLKNPLHTIAGYAELLAEEVRGPLNPPQHEAIAGIRAAAAHQLSMIVDLVDISRAEGGSLKIQPAETNIALLVESVARDHAKQAKQSGLDLEVSVADELPPLFTDARRVRQALQNLVGNALKYTPPGGRITLSATEREAPLPPSDSVWIAIDVSDTGAGIPEDQHEMVFQEFFRMDTHAEKTGAGLGLAIARRIARLLGGDITVASSTAGSTFTLWLPRDRRAQPPPLETSKAGG